MTPEDLYKKAIEKWGIEAQKDKAVEECAELIKAIIKERFNPNFNTRMDTVSEIADVIIMTEQLMIIYDEASIQKAINYKLNRLKETLNK